MGPTMALGAGVREWGRPSTLIHCPLSAGGYELGAALAIVDAVLSRMLTVCVWASWPWRCSLCRNERHHRRAAQRALTFWDGRSVAEWKRG